MKLPMAATSQSLVRFGAFFHFSGVPPAPSAVDVSQSLVRFGAFFHAAAIPPPRPTTRASQSLVRFGAFFHALMGVSPIVGILGRNPS